MRTQTLIKFFSPFLLVQLYCKDLYHWSIGHYFILSVRGSFGECPDSSQEFYFEGNPVYFIWLINDYWLGNSNQVFCRGLLAVLLNLPAVTKCFAEGCVLLIGWLVLNICLLLFKSRGRHLFSLFSSRVYFHLYLYSRYNGVFVFLCLRMFSKNTRLYIWCVHRDCVYAISRCIGYLFIFISVINYPYIFIISFSSYFFIY